MKYLFILLTCLYLTACKSETPPTEFSRNGVSFTVPAGWSISEEEDYGTGYYVSIEKEGFSESGIFMVTWIEGDMSAEEFLELNRESLLEQEVYNNLSFSPIDITKFGNYDAKHLFFTTDVMKIEHRGDMYSFSRCGKTVYVLKQEALEDSKTNMKGFEEFEKSFRVEEED